MARLAIDIDPTGAKRGAAVVKRELNGITQSASKTAAAMGGPLGGGAGTLSKVGLAASAASVAMVGLTTVALGFAAAAAADTTLTSPVYPAYAPVSRMATLGAPSRGGAEAEVGGHDGGRFV